MPGPLIDNSYVNGSQSLNYCPMHGLPYRPDERIYPGSSLRCPKDGHPLISKLDILRGRQVEDEGYSEFDEGINYIW